jgi:N-glycosylase/DNA lyase
MKQARSFWLVWQSYLTATGASWGYRMPNDPTIVESLGAATRRSARTRRAKTMSSRTSLVSPTAALSSARLQVLLTTPPTMTMRSTTLAAAVTPTFTPSALFSTSASCMHHDGGDKDKEYMQDLRVEPAEFRPSAVLTTGQCFHWKSLANDQPQPGTSNHDQVGGGPAVVSAWGTHNATDWIGTLRVPLSGETIVVRLREAKSTVLFQTISAPPSVNVQRFLERYFQLHVSVRDLYVEWSTQCDRLQRIATCIPGLRLIDQDPWECLVSFLCSSNNNIPRITKILQSIRQEYGDQCCTYQGEPIYTFPSLAELHKRATEADLRQKCGMGYRAKYLMGTMSILISLGGESYLQDLRNIDDPDVVQERLMVFPGIGRKVADCIALFSLQSVNAIPVDVHVWKIARRDYGAAEMTTKTLTPTAYAAVAQLFRARFPRHSGWAHSLLFIAELPSFRPVLPPDMIDEMDQVRKFFPRAIVAIAHFVVTVLQVSKGRIGTQEKEECFIKFQRLCGIYFYMWLSGSPCCETIFQHPKKHVVFSAPQETCIPRLCRWRRPTRKTHLPRPSRRLRWRSLEPICSWWRWIESEG